jgi:hypothetical protein
MDQIQTQNLICNIVWQSNVPNIKMNICKQTEKKRGKSFEITKFKGHNSSKNWSIATVFELDL